MKLSLMYEIQIPKPWTEGIEARTYGEVLEQVVLGDKIGCHAVWAVEHHLLPEWSHCPAPEVLFGALSQITKKIRLGHGIIQTGPGLQDGHDVVGDGQFAENRWFLRQIP